MKTKEDQQVRLATMIAKDRPGELSYELGEGREKIELLLTYVDGDNKESNYSARVESPPQFRQYSANGRTLIDITDSSVDTLRDIDDSKGTLRDITNSHGKVQNPFRNLRLSNPPRTSLGPRDTPYEMETLVIDLEDGSKLAVATYNRGE